MREYQIKLKVFVRFLRKDTQESFILLVFTKNVSTVICIEGG